MAVSEENVLKIASLARLHVEPRTLPTLVAQLNSILSHMSVLSKVDTSGVTPTAGVGEDGMPLRSDIIAPFPMQSTAEGLTASSRDGFILVPRLATHGDV